MQQKHVKELGGTRTDFSRLESPLWVTLSRMCVQTAAGDLPLWQLDFFLKGSLRLQLSPRPKPHAWLSDQVTLPSQALMHAS